mmetsp:Transcript_67645/g.209156  ORF Transcript_67645/g.209156 Transcript_67645/m.209156 type:complete len:264 (+) Transcript_67645:136-927(+)
MSASGRSLQIRHPTPVPRSRKSSDAMPHRLHCHSPVGLNAWLHSPDCISLASSRRSAKSACIGQHAPSRPPTCQPKRTLDRLIFFATNAVSLPGGSADLLLEVSLLGGGGGASPVALLARPRVAGRTSMSARSTAAGVPCQPCPCLTARCGCAGAHRRSRGVIGRMSVNSRMPSRWCLLASGPRNATEKNSMEMLLPLLSRIFAWKTPAFAAASSEAPRCLSITWRSSALCRKSWMHAPCMDCPEPPRKRMSDSLGECCRRRR